MNLTENKKLTWKDVTSPEVIYIREDEKASALFDSMVTDVTAYIHEICEDVCKHLYKDPSEVPFFNKITFKVDNHQGVAYKNGASPEVTVVLSGQYMENFKNRGGDLKTEIKGVLTHEIVHIYQFDSGIDMFIIDGIADLVRYLAGHVPLSARKLGGNHSDSYKTTAFFYDWLREKNKDRHDFLYELNKSASKENGGNWSFEKDFKEVAGGDVETLWAEYQKDLEENGMNALTSCTKENAKR